MQHCWLCRRDFDDDVRMIMPPRESSHICSECAYETPIGQHLMNRDKRLADGYYPGSYVRGERARHALRKAMGLPKQSFREAMGEKK